MKLKTTPEKVLAASKKLQELWTLRVKNETVFFSVRGIEWRFEYTDETGTLEIVIDDKPFYISQSTIEDKIKEFFL